MLIQWAIGNPALGIHLHIMAIQEIITFRKNDFKLHFLDNVIKLVFIYLYETNYYSKNFADFFTPLHIINIY